MNKNIYIPFRHDMKQSIISGIKTCTSRTRKYGDVGDYFILNTTKYVLESILKIPLHMVATNHYKEEGFSSPEQFIEVWKQIHPTKGFIPNQLVWVHFFS